MSKRPFSEIPWEPEWYDFQEGSPPWEVSRRQFFRIVGGGIVVALLLREPVDAQPSRPRGRRGFGAPQPREIGAWLHIGEDGGATVYTGKVEIGQNIRTSLTQTVAEELRLAVPRIRLVMADTAQTPFDMGTFGSRTTPDMAAQLRRVAAAAREASWTWR
ncbi:MAG TPA: molybdopterin cofactor-binding domain-containing protein, partial [Gemmataceae bacterium]|nr:molybdopterin cofactor-binding domain-containing protein [Gemmataceae bacterium]